MVIKFSFRSNRLHRLAVEVWEALPPAERAVLEGRTILLTDDPLALVPSLKIKKRPLSLAFSLGVTKFVFVVYLSRARLRQEPKDFVKAVIAHELALVRNAAPAPQPKPKGQGAQQHKYLI